MVLRVFSNMYPNILLKKPFQGEAPVAFHVDAAGAK
jgi:hypothetical protein